MNQTMIMLVLLTSALTNTNHVYATTPSCTNNIKGKSIISLGMSTALSGPVQHLGHSMLKGVSTRINEANCSPYWINKKKFLKLTVLDDSYIPSKAAENTQTLIEKNQVIAFIGNVGTPTAKASLDYIKKQGISDVLFYAPYSGAGIIRHKNYSNVFHYRASYKQEIDVIIQSIMDKGIQLGKVALFYQADSFGASAAGTIKEIFRQHFDITDDIQETTYQRNSLSIDQAIKAFIESGTDTEAIILISSYRPSAKFIRFAHAFLPKASMYNLSFSGATKLASSLPSIKNRVFITQVVKPIKKNELHVGFDEVATEGYKSTDVFIKALEKISGKITSENIIQALVKQEKDENAQSRLIKQTVKNKTLDDQLKNDVWLMRLNSPNGWVNVEVPNTINTATTNHNIKNDH